MSCDRLGNIHFLLDKWDLLRPKFVLIFLHSLRRNQNHHIHQTFIFSHVSFLYVLPFPFSPFFLLEKNSFLLFFFGGHAYAWAFLWSQRKCQASSLNYINFLFHLSHLNFKNRPQDVIKPKKQIYKNDTKCLIHEKILCVIACTQSTTLSLVTYIIYSLHIIPKLYANPSARN